MQYVNSPSYGVQVRFHGADMRRPQEIRELAARAEAELGRVDIVVNNAGIQHVAPVEDFPQERWEPCWPSTSRPPSC